MKCVRLPELALWSVPLLSLVACLGQPKDSCRTDDDCLADRVCTAGICRPPARDASTEVRDVGNAETRADGTETPPWRSDGPDVPSAMAIDATEAPPTHAPDAAERDGDLGPDVTAVPGATAIDLALDREGPDQPSDESDVPLTQTTTGPIDAQDGPETWGSGGRGGEAGFDGAGGAGGAGDAPSFDAPVGTGGNTATGGMTGTGASAGTGGTLGSGGASGAGGSPPATTEVGGTATVGQSAVAVADVVFTGVPAWSDGQIYAQFKVWRNRRYLYGDDHPGFARRLPWLYPDAGAEDRAELLVSAVSVDCSVPPCRPYKLFVLPKNAATRLQAMVDGRRVEWSWYVAPIVRSATSGEVMVLDPTLEPTRPLGWKDWLLVMAPSLEAVKLTVADPHAYDLASPVTGGPSQLPAARLRILTQWLPAEWQYQVQRGRSPELVLGGAPPWGTERQYVISTKPFTVVGACTTCLATMLSARCLADCP